jgi:DNA-binding MarR family transcriptional regulator
MDELAFAYPLERALEAVKQDPSTLYAAFVAVHPEAYLTEAVYDRHQGVADADPGAEAEPGWRFTFADEGDAARMRTAQTDPGPASPYRGSGLETVNRAEASPRTGQGEIQQDQGAAVPADELGLSFVDGHAVEEVLDRHGLDAEDPEHFAFRVDPSFPSPTPSTELWVANVSFAQPDETQPPAGALAHVDASTGGLQAVWTLEATPHHWDQAPGEPATVADVHGVGHGDVPTGPEAGLGIAAASVLGLLVMLAKALSWPLFTRKPKDELLDNEVRRQLVAKIEEDPGIHLQDLIDHSGVGNGAVRHHLRKLDDAGLVERVRIDGYVRFFPPDVDPEERTKIATLRAGCNAPVYRLVRQDPGMSVRDVAAELDRSPSTVFRALETLRERGVLADE